jgi:hypothetical protein
MTDIESLYRETFTDRQVTPDESSSLVEYFSNLQSIADGSTVPPMTPDQMVWLRASAFKIACEFIDEDKEENVKLFKAVNAVVQALETTCLLPGLGEGGEDFSKEAAEELLCSLYSGDGGEGGDDEEAPGISCAEADALQEFLTSDATRPPLDCLMWLRSSAFRIGSQYLDEDGDKDKNVALFRSVNVVVHIIEKCCMK